MKKEWERCEAIARFNSWQCPVCSRFVRKPAGDIGMCSNCGSILHFSVMQPPVEEEIIELRDEVPVEGPVETGVTPPISLGDALITYLLHTEEDKKLEAIKKLTNEVVGLDHRYTVVNFTNRPYLFKFFKEYKKDGMELSLSETIVGFAAKGVKCYLEEKKTKTK